MIACERIPIETSAAGAADVLSKRPISGEIVEIRQAGTSLNEAAKADWTITRKDDGGAVLTLANVDGPWTRSPRQATHDVAGAAALYAPAGAAVLGRIPISGHLRVQLAQAKASTKGELLVFYEC